LALLHDKKQEGGAGSVKKPCIVNDLCWVLRLLLHSSVTTKKKGSFSLSNIHLVKLSHLILSFSFLLFFPLSFKGREYM
jgi:hypothetical protein